MGIGPLIILFALTWARSKKKRAYVVVIETHVYGYPSHLLAANWEMGAGL
jgi:hypothetical protein